MDNRLAEVTQKLQRDVNCLSDDNRATRKRALERLHKESVGHTPPYSPALLQGLMEFMLKPLLKMISDPIEKCRELAINLITDFSSSVEDVTVYLPLMMPVLAARLGTPEITEPSEELRLNYVTYLTFIVGICAAKMAPYLNDMISILQRTLGDPYPEVKKESCICCSKLAEAIPATFHQQSETLAKPLLKSMVHQHSKVRVACIKAFGSSVRYGSPNPINDALPVLAQRACDPTPSVRSCLADTVGMWLLELPDRYSYHHKLIPLLLTCTNDDLTDIRTKSYLLWDKVGSKYEEENEDDLKDKLDFIQPIQVAPILELPRPRLGCRVLVCRNFSKILPAILRDITDWTVESRIKSSQLLFTLLYHMENHVTHHLQSVINGLYKACQDDEPFVVDQSVKCAEIIGFYVSPEVWCKLVLPAVKTSAGCHVRGTDQASTVAVGPVQCTSCLQVLGALVRGAKQDTLKPYMKSITECLAEPEVSHSEHLPLLRQLIACIAAVVQASDDACSEYSLPLFTTLQRVQGSKHSANLQDQIVRTLSSLAEVQGMEDTACLYEIHIKDILSHIKVRHKSWTVNSPDCVLFSSLLSGAGPIIGQILDDVMPILTTCLNPDADAEMRLHFITALMRLLLDAPSSVESQQNFSTFAGHIVTDVIVPNLVWKGGRTAAAIRTASMTCLQILLQEDMLSTVTLNGMHSNLLPQIVSCMDDDNQSTRLVSCKVLRLLLMVKPALFNVDSLHSLYPDLLKRLDDSSDEIRVATTAALLAYISAFPDDYSQDLYKAHSEALFKALLVHLDDPSPEIQTSILEVLKQAARLNKQILTEQVEAVKHKHRSTRYCEELLQALQ